MRDGFLAVSNSEVSAGDTRDMSVEGPLERRTTVCLANVSMKVAGQCSLVPSPQINRHEFCEARSSIQSVEMECSSSTLVESTDNSATKNTTAPDTLPNTQPSPASVYCPETSAEHMYEAASLNGPSSANPSSPFSSVTNPPPPSPPPSSSPTPPLPTQKNRPHHSVRFALQKKDDRDSENYNPRRRVFTKKHAGKLRKLWKNKMRTKLQRHTVDKSDETPPSAISKESALLQNRPSVRVTARMVDVRSAASEDKSTVNEENKSPIRSDSPVAAVTSQHSGIPLPGKKRKQPLLIAEDSMFLLVPDPKTTEMAVDPVEQQQPVVLLERQSSPNLMVNDAISSVSKTQERRPSVNAYQGDDGDRLSVASSGHSSDRPHRRTMSHVSYCMPSLRKKIHQGDSDWCKE
ncbi:unnamed protein product [Schistocephalus solidus]|uniref:DUF4614 domain-containing protein n=1 Tax=Schistocephalus solidus TaxID=70667 RepID=A0A183TGF7_SCHSO|nr:unnamed protein product [Schistocephalus solidus]